MRILSSYLALLLSLSFMIGSQLTFGLTKISPASQLLHINITNPHQLDQLWLAYFTYEDTRYLDKVIQTYANTVIDPNFDFMDIVMLAQCHDKAVCKKRFAAEYEALPKKYPTKESMIRLIIAATAFWSLTSNAYQHPSVDAHIEKYIQNTPHTMITLPLKVIIETIKSNNKK